LLDFIFIRNCVKTSFLSLPIGSPPTVYEIMISVWVLSLYVEEVIEALRRGLKSYVHDWWNWNDMLQLLLFTVWFILR